MSKKKKLTNNFNMFFLTIIFEKENFFFFENTSLIKNSQYIYFNKFNILYSIKFFLELKPVSLTDMVTFDTYYIEKIDYNIYTPTTTFYTFFSYKLNSYKYLYSGTNIYYSLSNYYKNSIWLEREQLEFFGVFFLNMYDCRNLLLEYDFDKNIFLKQYGLSGTNNYYSVFPNKINHIENIFNII